MMKRAFCCLFFLIVAYPVLAAVAPEPPVDEGRVEKETIDAIPERLIWSGTERAPAVTISAPAKSITFSIDAPEQDLGLVLESANNIIYGNEKVRVNFRCGPPPWINKETGRAGKCTWTISRKGRDRKPIFYPAGTRIEGNISVNKLSRIKSSYILAR